MSVTARDPALQVDTMKGVANGTTPNSPGSGDAVTSPRFLSSFLIDARGGTVQGSRHAGVRVIIPPGKVCMPTRITCKLVKGDKLTSPPQLKEGEAIVTRALELGPVGFQFNGPVLIELPHIASLRDDEREVIALRSDDGISWHEHPITASEIVASLLKFVDSEGAGGGNGQSTVSIVCTDFPRYFVAISRVRLVSRMVGNSGGSLKTDSMPVATTAAFPVGSVKKETRVGLQTLPVPSHKIQLVLGPNGSLISASPVITVEPRRRRFHVPINLTIPAPGKQGKSSKDSSKLHLFYSISGGTNRSQWEDITGSAPLNFVKDSVSFSTMVSARFWLVDYEKMTPDDSSSGEMIEVASKVYSEAVAVPIIARFVVFTRSHHEAEAQLRLLCITEDFDASTTLECQEQFHEIARSDPVELIEGKSYCVELSGNLKPTVASSSQLGITVHAFRVNRLSFVVKVDDPSKRPDGCMKFLPAQRLLHSMEIQHGREVCRLPVSLVETTVMDIVPEQESEDVVRNFEVARQQAVLSRESSAGGSGGPEPTLRLGDIALALQGDWLMMATQLGITSPEVIKIQKEFGSVTEQAMMMLHLWIAKAGPVQVSEVEHALKRIGREDIIKQCIHGNPADDSAAQLANGSAGDDTLRSIDSPLDEHAFDVNSHLPQESEPNPSEVEEGAVYQIEDIWDGKQWHKSKKMLPDEAGDAGGDKVILDEGVSISVRSSEPSDATDVAVIHTLGSEKVVEGTREPSEVAVSLTTHTETAAGSELREKSEEPEAGDAEVSETSAKDTELQPASADMVSSKDSEEADGSIAVIDHPPTDATETDGPAVGQSRGKAVDIDTS